jgi:hypothetical protein
MATPAQIAANRRNALKSTGPKTGRGKAASSRNGRAQGFCITRLLPEEDPAGFESLVTRLLRDPTLIRYASENQIREFAGAKWRLQRARRAEDLAANLLQNPSVMFRVIAGMHQSQSKYNRICGEFWRDLVEKMRVKRLKSQISNTNPISRGKLP